MTNKILLFIFFTSLFLFSLPLWAQTPGGGGHYVIEQRYVRRLVWIGDEYTLKYEVVIEQNENGKYKTYLQEFTGEPNLLVSLPLGKYRYRIIPYDYLELPGEASKWVNFEIKPAPVVSADEPKDETSPGVDDVIIINHDEPETQEEQEVEEPYNLFINIAWQPVIPLYGRLREIFGNEFYAVGASVCFGALYNGLQWFKPGIELSMSWYSHSKTKSGDTIGVQTGITGFNIIAQKELPFPGMAVTLRAGAALVYQVGEINIEDYSYTTGGLIPQINIEASFLWFAYKKLYLEAGLGFSHLTGKENNSGSLRPKLGAGWQF